MFMIEQWCYRGKRLRHTRSRLLKIVSSSAGTPRLGFIKQETTGPRARRYRAR
jgi:hypothetical protein